MGNVYSMVVYCMNRCFPTNTLPKQNTAQRLPVWLIGIVFCFGVCSQATAERGRPIVELKPFTATYSVSAYNMDMGLVIIRLSRGDKNRQTWLSETIIIPQGLGEMLINTIHSSTRWRWHKQKIMLLESTEKGSRPHDEYYLFDYKEGRIVGSYKGRDVQHDIPDDPVLDLNTLFIKLLMDIRAGKNPSGDYQLIRRGRLREYWIHDHGETVLKSQRLRDLEREKKGQTDQRYWLNPAYRYLPVQMERLGADSLQLLIKAKKIIQEK